MASVNLQDNKLVLTGWAVMLAGAALWMYGYFVTGHPSVVAWNDHAPHWIADFLPNLESEIGMVLTLVAMVPIYWPTRD
jgi:hypothetical protein